MPPGSDDKKSRGPTMEEIDRGYRMTIPATPKVTIAEKQEMVIGGNVPSWTNSIPGPKYKYDIDVIKERAPHFTVGEKIEMVIGGGVPSWTNSIPGPKYAYDANVVKERQPVYSMSGGGRGSPKGAESEKKMLERDVDAAQRLERAFNFTKKGTPSFSMTSRQENVIGGDVVSWKRSIPGPYTTDIGQIRAKQPCYTIGKKLPDESDLMKTRSPGPKYENSAMDVKLQEKCDSTKKRSFSCGFGIGPRWEGVTQDLLLSGAWSRYDKRPPRPQASSGRNGLRNSRSASTSAVSKRTGSVAQ